MQSDARRSSDALQRLPALLAAVLPVTDVTPLQTGAGRAQPPAVAQIAPVDRAWLQGVLENSLQLAAERVLEKQVSRLYKWLFLPIFPRIGSFLCSCGALGMGLLEGNFLFGGCVACAQQERAGTAVPALLADEQWDALGKRLRGIEQSVQVSAIAHAHEILIDISMHDVLWGNSAEHLEHLKCTPDWCKGFLRHRVLSLLRT